MRFSDELWAQVQQASQRAGVSAAQVVREATLVYLAVESQVGGVRREVAIMFARLDQRLCRIEETLRRHGLR